MSDDPGSSNKSESFFKNFMSWFKLNDKTTLEDKFSEVLEEHENASGEKLSPEEKDILSNAINFSELTVEEIKIPRSDVIAINHDSSPNFHKVISAFNRHAHTRIPVYKESLDNIIGFVHIKDLTKFCENPEEFSLDKIIRQCLLVPPSMKVSNLLVEMRKRRVHIAIVVDEYGGTDGIVTIEDAIEELVGEIDDEHDSGNKLVNYRRINDNTIIANSRMDVEELERITGSILCSDDDEFETVGGLIMARAGQMPKQGSTIDIGHNIKAEILEAGPKSIKEIKIIFEEA